MNISDLKVLIIEDELIFARQLESWLKKKVAKVFVSTNSENGTYFISQEKPDIIFLDNMLPGINGIDVIEFYKEKSPNTTLVLMSSVFRMEEISRALKNGADYVLNKKNENEEGLEAILKASLKSKETGSPFWKFIQFIAPQKSSSSKQIAILEDEELFSFQLSLLLNNLPSNKKHTVLRFSSKEEFVHSCTKNGFPDVLFLDFFLSDGTGQDILNYMNTRQQSCKSIIISSKIDPDTAIKLNLEGVSEFILKDENWQENILQSAAHLNL